MQSNHIQTISSMNSIGQYIELGQKWWILGIKEIKHEFDKSCILGK